MAGRYPSLHLISRFQSAIDRLFEEALAMGEGELPALDWQPSVDLVETPDAILLLAEVPGLSASDLTVEIKGMRVTLSGTKPAPLPAAESPRFLRVERGQGRFVREVQLFGPVNGHAGSARLAGGLLTLTFPKVEEKRQAARVLQITDTEIETETESENEAEASREGHQDERMRADEGNR
jgi:HSP20 family protein